MTVRRAWPPADNFTLPMDERIDPYSHRGSEPPTHQYRGRIWWDLSTTGLARERTTQRCTWMANAFDPDLIGALPLLSITSALRK